ncbi:PH domain-containing protein [Cellulomonas sp. WB94]|uniref:PH domain-containing protein n=1 Tax=Cellulomonas sp. WB94 TaxID=2173174 RepID=UPI001304F61E|nr:PH domain-containing protein [Cellulomonas sp. WB94]
MGPERVFAATSGRVLNVVAAVAALAALVGSAASGGLGELLRYGAIPVLGLVVVWALFWCPQVEVSDGEIVLRNVLRTVRIPWPTFRGADTRLSLSIDTTDGTFTAWAAPARSALGARADAATPRGPQLAPPWRGRNQADGHTADVVALEIAARRESLERAGHLRPGPPPTGVHVTTTWHLRTIAVVAVLAVLAVAGAVLG